jgi:hypothetical protein
MKMAFLCEKKDDNIYIQSEYLFSKAMKKDPTENNTHLSSFFIILHHGGIGAMMMIFLRGQLLSNFRHDVGFLDGDFSKKGKTKGT